MPSHQDRVRRSYATQPGAIFRRMPVADCKVETDLRVDQFDRCLGVICGYFDNGDAYVQTLGWVGIVVDSGKLGAEVAWLAGTGCTGCANVTTTSQMED